MNKHKAILLSALFFVATAWSQTVVVVEQEPEKRMTAYFAFGGARLDIEDMNGFLSDAQLAEVSENGFVFGVGSNGFYKRIVTGLQLNGIFWKEDTRANRTSDLSAIYGLFSAGFNIFPDRRFRLYPLLEFGPALMKFTVRDEEVPFDQALAQPSNTRSFVQSGLILGGAVGFDYEFPSFHMKKEGMTLGIRVGYGYDPTPRNDWEIEDAEVNFGPKASFTGAYARLIIGKSFSKPKRMEGGIEENGMNYGGI